MTPHAEKGRHYSEVRWHTHEYVTTAGSNISVGKWFLWYIVTLPIHRFLGEKPRYIQQDSSNVMPGKPCRKVDPLLEPV